MPRRHQRPVRDLPDVFLGRHAVEEGALTPSQLRGPLVRRVVQGVYRPAWVPLTHELACQAAALVLPPAACLTGRSAATLRGVPLASSRDLVEVCIPESQRLGGRAGLSIRRTRGPIDPVEEQGLPVAGPHRMAFDLAARHPLPLAVAHLDAVTRAGHLDPAAFGRWLDDRSDNDVRAVCRALSLVDPRAESLPESQTRVHLVEAGFEVVPQFEVRLGRQLVARVDLALPDLRIAIEYDGLWHALRQQLTRDRERLNAFARADWLLVHVTGDMLQQPSQLVAAVHAAVHARTGSWLRLIG